jgi:hypothetical protein
MPALTGDSGDVDLADAEKQPDSQLPLSCCVTVSSKNPVKT